MGICNGIIRADQESGAVYLGVWNTLNVRSQQFDISDWIARFGAGQLSVLVLRPGETIPYAAENVTVENGVATWTFNEADTEIAGFGSVALAYLVGDEYKARTIPFKTYVAPTLGDSTVDPPDPLIGWFERVLTAAADAQQSATDAAAAKAAAETAQSLAEAAQTAAETAKGKAEDAQSAAETAQGLAENAKSAAEIAQEKAEDAQTAAATAQTAAETAQGKAEDAQTAAESAQGKAEDAQSAAETAQGLAETAQSAAETAQEKAEDAQATTEGMMESVVASEYSASATYEKGDYVLYSGVLYRAKQDVETAEVWTETHWERVSVCEALRQLQTAVSAPETYAQLQALVRSGLAYLSVKAGDQVAVKVGGADFDFDVLGVDEDCPVGTPTGHVLSLQMHDILGQGSVRYDNPQLLYAVTEEKFPSGMGAGVYSITLDHGALNNSTSEDGIYSFVIPQGASVPVGGGLRHSTMGSSASSYAPSRIVGGTFICYGADRVTAVSGLNTLTTFAPLTFAAGSALTGSIAAETFYAKAGAAGGRYTFYYDAVAGRWLNFETAADVDLSEYGITLTGQPSDQEEIVVTLGKMLGTTTARNLQYLSRNEPVNYTSRQYYGSGRWSTSFLRQYLNSDASPMAFDYTKAGLFGRPAVLMPSAGFLYSLDPELKKVLCETTKRYALTAADGAGYEDVTDKVSLCTKTDLGLGANNGIYEGAAENGALKRQTAYSLWQNAEASDRRKAYQGSFAIWHMSSSHTRYPYITYCIVSSGASADLDASTASGIVPCIYIG